MELYGSIIQMGRNLVLYLCMPFSMSVNVYMVKFAGFHDSLFQSKISQSLYFRYSGSALHVTLYSEAHSMVCFKI